MSLIDLLSHAPEPIGSRAELFIDGAKATLQLTIISAFVGLFAGLVLALLKKSPMWIIRAPGDFVIWIMRGTPLLVQILFAYYALPALIPSLQMSEFSAAVLALTINVGAYNAEVFRAGFDAVPKGQWEAAKSLGLGRINTFRIIIFPQALKIVIPPLVNNVVALLKDSSLASSIGLLELTLAGNRVSSETFLPVPVLSTVAIFYLFLTSIITLITSLLERYFKKRIGAK